MTSTNLSISDRLALVGIRHERDAQSRNNDTHALYRGEEFIGRFTALEACEMLDLGVFDHPYQKQTD